MNPKHINEVPQNRRAVAPYNFVELPEKIVSAQDLPSGDRYYSDRCTGRIECTLTTESPLYTRCGWTAEDFAVYGDTAFTDLPEEIKQKRANFFINPATKQPTILGSSIRGMLRTLIEIVTFGKIDRVSGQQHFFFRAVAAEADDPLKEEYKKYIKPKNIRAGYLLEKADSWFLRPAMPIEQEPFVWVKEDRLSSIPELIRMNDLSNYRPQYFINVSFQDIYPKNNRRFAEKVSKNCSTYQYKGVVVTSGNMLEGGTNPATLRRRHHCIIREPDSKAELIPISENAIRDYYSALTPFQKQEPPFERNRGVLKNGRCIFYCEPKNGEPVTLFGHSPNFRIPYSYKGNGLAATARDFIPDFLKDSQDESIMTDIAEAIFGFVRVDKQPESQEQSRGGRVFFSDGRLTSHQEQQVRESQNRESQEILLSSPKPTTFQHYLIQKTADKVHLKHYASKPPCDTEAGETVIRGHKLYWHKPALIEVPTEVSDTQTSLIKPLDSGTEFTFSIEFENLTKVELGALLWLLSLSGEKSQSLGTGKTGEEYRFSLGMGKPLGLGAVKIDYKLHLSTRASRYKQLFTGSSWNISEELADLEKERTYIQKFEQFMLDAETGISENDHPEEGRAASLKDVPRIEMLLAMLRWDLPEMGQTRYMTLEPNNEYKARLVLPTPLQVAHVKDRRKKIDGAASSTPSKKAERLKYKQSDQLKSVVQNQYFTVGQVVEATVKRIAGNKVTYEIQGELKSQKEPKKYGTLRVGQKVKVEITALKENGSLKSLKLVD